MTLTTNQRAAFFAECTKAARELGLNREGAEAYRHRVLDEEAGVSSVKEIKHQAQFSACLRRFRIDAGDYDGAVAVDTSGTTEMEYVMLVMAAQILQMKEPGLKRYNTPFSSSLGPAGDYLDGVFRQAGFKGVVCGVEGGWALDLTVRQARHVIAILDEYRRKRIRTLFGNDAPTAYSDRVRFENDGVIVKRLPVPGGWYAHEFKEFAVRITR